MLVDTHCHLDAAPLGANVDDVLARARARGVERVLVPGVRAAEWSAIASLRDRHPGVAMAIGLHPHALPDLAASAAEAAYGTLVDRARALDAAAIGECGFDARTARDHGVSLERQAASVRVHAEAADALGLPLVVHVVGAMGFALDFFESRGAMAHGAILHAFGGPSEVIPRWVKLGFSFGVGPAITWPRARRPKEAARLIPLDRLLLETDGPETYVAGAEPRVGEPAQIRDVLVALRDLRPESASELESRTTENALQSLFARAPG